MDAAGDVGAGKLEFENWIVTLIQKSLPFS